MITRLMKSEMALLLTHSNQLQGFCILHALRISCAFVLHQLCTNIVSSTLERRNGFSNIAIPYCKGSGTLKVSLSLDFRQNVLNTKLADPSASRQSRSITNIANVSLLTVKHHILCIFYSPSHWAIKHITIK